MALGKRYTAQKRIVIAMQARFGGLVDPAVDLQKSDLEAYWESDFDPSHLKFIEGETPSWFTIRPLNRRQKDALDVAVGERSSISWYIRCASRRVENYTIQQPDGSFVDAPQPTFEKRGDLGEIASEDWLDEVNYPVDLRVALFHCIHKISEPSLPLSVPSRPRSGDSKLETQGQSG